LVYCRHGSIIERDAYVNQLRCNFLDVRIAKKKKKGTQGLKKSYMQQQWATVSLTVFFTPPLNNCMGKVVIYFSPVKMLPVSEKYAGGAHKRLSNV
jgi:hypothetical protein